MYNNLQEELMALFLKQNDDRTQLQKKIVAELQDKARQSQKNFSNPDGVDDSVYVKDLKPNKHLSWFWVILVLLCSILLIWLISTFLSR